MIREIAIIFLVFKFQLLFQHRMELLGSLRVVSALCNNLQLIKVQ